MPAAELEGYMPYADTDIPTIFQYPDLRVASLSLVECRTMVVVEVSLKTPFTKPRPNSRHFCNKLI